MDFLDIGPLEILVILIIAFLLFGPDKLPQIAGAIGKGLRKLKEATTELSKEFQEAAGDVKDAGKETSETVGLKGGLAADLKDVAGEIKDVAKEINADLKAGTGLTGEVGREMQDVAQEITTALKPDMGLPRESQQAAGGTALGTGAVAEDAPGANAVGPVHSPRETEGESGQGEEKV
jgi:TatA/E family protein of Tat protein translocase